MSSFELNKIMGAILGALLVVTAIGHIADLLTYHDVAHEGEEIKRGYRVEITEDISVPDSGLAEDQVLGPIAGLLATASVENGAVLAKKCISCHTFDQGGPNKIGPNLWDIVGKKQASIEGFPYSKGFAALDGVWDYENLNALIYKPSKYVKGTKMSFAGLAKAEDRADMIAYLRSLSDNPHALPNP